MLEKDNLKVIYFLLSVVRFIDSKSTKQDFIKYIFGNNYNM